MSLYDPERDRVRTAGRWLRWSLRWAVLPALLGVFTSGNVDLRSLPVFGPERLSAVLFLDGQAYFGHLDDSGESGTLVKTANAYHELEIHTGLTISIKTPSTRKPTESFLPYRLTASCMDHPGIVHKLSQILSRHGINIESMETKTYAAPVSGTPIFQLEANIAIPVRTNINQLRARFAEIQREENIDIDLTAAKN